MLYEVFNRIVYDNKLDVISCLSDTYICAAMTANEILEIVPEIKKIMNSNNMSELSIDVYDFIYNLPLPEKTLETWEENGIKKIERYFIALAYSASKLEDMRYHICDICNDEYFSTDVLSEFCDKCTSKYYS